MAKLFDVQLLPNFQQASSTKKRSNVLINYLLQSLGQALRQLIRESQQQRCVKNYSYILHKSMFSVQIVSKKSVLKTRKWSAS